MEHISEPVSRVMKRLREQCPCTEDVSMPEGFDTTYEHRKIKVACPTCDTEFVKLSPKHVYRSTACHEPKHRGVCAVCGKPFETNHEDGQFCSRMCAGTARRKPENDRHCEICGEPYHAKSKEQRFCGRVCGNVHRARMREAAKNA